MIPDAGGGSGLLFSLRRLGSTVVEVVHTRLELLATELEEERGHLAQILWLAAIGAFCVAASTLFVAVFVVVLFWDSHRLLAIGLLACGFGIVGAAFLLMLRARVTARKRLFAQSLAELRSDQDHLSP